VSVSGGGEGDYLRAVEARALALRGRGYALSATDVDRICRWLFDGIPLGLVLETLEAAVRRARGAGKASRRPVSLGIVERSLQAAMRARAERLGPMAGASEAGRAAEPTPVEGTHAAWAALKGAVVAAGECQVDAFMKDALREVWRALAAAEKRDEDPWLRTVALDQMLGSLALAALGEAEQEALTREVRAALGDGPMSRGARAERESFELFQRVRARFGIPELLEVLLGS
jgi:hypothetical protein